MPSPVKNIPCLGIGYAIVLCIGFFVLTLFINLPSWMTALFQGLIAAWVIASYTNRLTCDHWFPDVST